MTLKGYPVSATPEDRVAGELNVLQDDARDLVRALTGTPGYIKPNRTEVHHRLLLMQNMLSNLKGYVAEHILPTRQVQGYDDRTADSPRGDQDPRLSEEDPELEKLLREEEAIERREEARVWAINHLRDAEHQFVNGFAAWAYDQATTGLYKELSIERLWNRWYYTVQHPHPDPAAHSVSTDRLLLDPEAVEQIKGLQGFKPRKVRDNPQA